MKKGEKTIRQLFLKTFPYAAALTMALSLSGCRQEPEAGCAARRKFAVPMPLGDETGNAMSQAKERLLNAKCTVTLHGRINEDMPEFTFTIDACLDRERDSYSVERLTISDGEVLQTISIPELSIFGRTGVYSSLKDTMGFGLEDVNFDGFQDIRLFDTPNGNYRVDWIYLVWNPETRQFEHDPRLNDIVLASFDQENRLIYGMQRGGAVDHYYSTYRYLDGEPVLIRYVTEEFLPRDAEQIRRYLSSASVETEAAVIVGSHQTISERNDATGEMEMVLDEYVFYSNSDSEGNIEDTALLKVEASSEIGRMIIEDGLNGTEE